MGNQYDRLMASRSLFEVLIALSAQLLSPGEISDALLFKELFQEIILVQEAEAEGRRKLPAQRRLSAGW